MRNAPSNWRSSAHFIKISSLSATQNAQDEARREPRPGVDQLDDDISTSKVVA